MNKDLASLSGLTAAQLRARAEECRDLAAESRTDAGSRALVKLAQWLEAMAAAKDRGVRTASTAPLSI